MQRSQFYSKNVNSSAAGLTNSNKQKFSSNGRSGFS
jgi:hypothetical protein